MSRPPVLVVSNEFFIVPGNNPFANGGQQLYPEPIPGGSTIAHRRFVFGSALLLITVG
jgi:hypothetical protein